MNERILELVLQADQYERKLGKGIGTSRDEKFAELIQQDCLQHLTNTGQDHAREILERYFDSR